MSRADLIECEWRYTPDNYFESPLSIDRDDYTIKADTGLITVFMTATKFYAEPLIRDELEDFLHVIFLSRQLFKRKDYTLIRGGFTRIDHEGRRHTTIQVHDVVQTHCISDEVDLIYTDPNGQIHDAKKERIASENAFALKAARLESKNPTVRHILTSYYASIQDPENELVHLYEVWEAIALNLGGEKTTLNILNLKKSEKDLLT